MATHLANESALVAEARLGNGAAFEILVRQYRSNLHHLAFRVTGNYEDAEEVTQEALLKAYCNLQRFRAESRFYTWLSRITLNEALIRLRKQRAERVWAWQAFTSVRDEEGNSVLPETVGPDANPEASYAGLELEHLLLKGASRALGPLLYRSFILQCVQDYSAQETAKILGISEAAQKSRALRARRRLQHTLAQRLLGPRAASHAARHRPIQTAERSWKEHDPPS